MAYIISSGESSNGIILENDNMTVLDGGIANSTTLRYGSMYVSSDGVVNNTEVNFSGLLEASFGGIANSTTINFPGSMYVSSGGIANDTTVNSGGRFVIFNGGTANRTTVNFGGRLYVSSGGTATNIRENGGYIEVYDYTNISFVPNSFSGLILSRFSATVHSGTTANSTMVTGGALYVSSGGTVNNTMLFSGGKLCVSSGGTANNTTVNYICSLFLHNGGTANNVIVSAGGSVSVGKDCIITGQLTFIQGGSVFLNSQAFFDFNISDHTPNAPALVNNHYLISGTPIYTLTVSETQIGGIYTLADYATNFNSSIAVQNVLGKALGTLSLDKSLVVGDTSYTLSLDSSLTLTVDAPDRIAPTVSNIQASLTTLTNQDVVLTADYADAVELAQSLYKLGEKGKWTAYPGSVTVSKNTTVFFKAIDAAGNETIVSYDVTNIDKVAPETPETTADITTPTNGDVLVTATFSEDSVLKEYSLDGENWGVYAGGVLFSSNRTAYFRSIDAVGNISEIAEYEVTNIDRTAPNKPVVSADVTTLTNQSVMVSAKFDEDSSTKEYSLDGEKWLTYTNAILCVKNETVSFRGIDEAGNVSEVASLEVSNIDTEAPSDPTRLRAVVSEQTVAMVWNASADDGSGVKEYVVSYSFNGQDFTVRTANTNYVLNNADFGSYSWTVQAVDFAGNESAVAAGDAFTVSGFKPYTVEYSPDNFEHIITFAVTTPTLNAFRMPGGIYQMRVRQEGSSEWLTGDSIVAPAFEETPQLVKSDSDGNADVFFANPVGTWESGYVAQHVGSINDWGGTNEYASVYGKNKLADIIEGSTDANILLMTNDDNGDTLFVDDIYTASPGNMAEQQARIARINEIRAGAGNDVVDMTSQQFEYVGDGLTIRGGAGNDTIWANKGDNRLFGDAGNDRIVGASGNDVIAGGIGNDRMHGGGGNDVFTFCENWGADNVEQLETGSVTLWFASGSIANWDEAALTYTDGENSVKVSGIAADRITLKFGDDGSEQFAALNSAGAFFDATTERVFEESGKGMLASL